MAAAVASQGFGAELKDSFKPVNAWVGLGIGWLDEIEQFFRERSAIEKEYASKLKALANKYQERKGKKLGSLSVGDTPTLTPGSLESASLTTWGTQLTTLEKRSGEQERFAVELISQVADPLKQFATKSEQLRKNHGEYNTKLEKERDEAYATLKRMKGKYDGACQELESKRKKQDSSFDMNKAKAQQSYQQQVLETANVKNSYLIAINVTNKSKEKYYHEYVPELLDSLQDLNETRVNYINNTWMRAASIEEGVLTRSTTHMQHLSGEIPRNDPKLDSLMFSQHNKPKWQEPANMGFEPSPVWHDDSAFVVDDSAKIYLRNILSRSKVSRAELRRELDSKRREVDKLQNQRFALKEGKVKGDEVNVVQLLFALKNELHEAERKWMTAETEVNTIITVVGDISIGAQNHNFKGTTFKIPTNCDLCGDRIWGLSAKGFDCKDCGYTCHSKCELKVPANCPGEVSKEEKKKLKAQRQEAANAALPVPSPSRENGAPPTGVPEMPALGRRDTMNSLSSGYAASAQRSVSGVPAAGAEEPPSATALTPKPAIAGRKNRLVAPPPTAFIGGADTNGAAELHGTSAPSHVSAEPRGKMMYAYTASGDGEISVEEGSEITILEPDDGSGWATVRTSYGESGVVPATYFEQLPPSIPMSTRPVQSANRPQSSYSTTSSTGSGAISNQGSTASLASAIKKKGPAVAPRRGAKKVHYVTALYEYEARSDSEFSMKEGERFVLINRDAGDGWADVERGGVTKSVPANYLGD